MPCWRHWLPHSAKSVVWLQGFREHPLSRKILALANIRFQRAALEGKPADVKHLVLWLRATLSAEHAGQQHCLCAWFATGFSYFGIAGLSRAGRPDVSGLVCDCLHT